MPPPRHRHPTAAAAAGPHTAGVHGRRELPKPTCTTNAICLGCLKDKCSQCAGGYSLDSKGVCVQVRGAESVVVVVDACR